MHRPMRYSTSRKRQYLRNMPYTPIKNIAVIQSNHRNASLVHSHIAVLQFAFFFSKLACKHSTLSRTRNTKFTYAISRSFITFAEYLKQS